MTVFILILVAILLILLNINAIRKENKSFSQALDNKSQNITDYEVELGKLRKEFAETILELQKEIETLKISIKSNDSRDDEEWAKDSVLGEEFREEQETLEKNDSKESRKNDVDIHRGSREDTNNKKNMISKANKENVQYNKLKDIKENSELDMKISSETYGIQKNNEDEDVTEMKDFETSKIKDVETDNIFVETYNNSGKKNNKIIKDSSNNNDKDISNDIKNIDKKVQNNKSVKLEEISRMLQDGLSIDEIAEKVGMGKGEVLLIKELYIRQKN